MMPVYINHITLRYRNPKKNLQSFEAIPILPAEEEDTLEEFTWAFGEETVQELEQATHAIIEHLHQMPDIERLSDEGIKEHFESWHTLGALDEDEILHRIELHIDELPKEMHKEHRHIVELIEKRRSRIREKGTGRASGACCPTGTEPHSPGKCVSKNQNPEAMRKWKEWKNEGLISLFF